jgi:sulfatase maturation enzyme AslB (radical SAM superfamily)
VSPPTPWSDRVDALIERAYASFADQPLPALPLSGPDFLQDAGPFEALSLLATHLQKLPQPDAHTRSAARQLDDAERRLVFRRLTEARRTPAESATISRATQQLGPIDDWLRAFERSGSMRLARAVLIVTWQCELRCSYCWIPKQDGRVMTPETVTGAVELLMSSDNAHVNLQFFGGEALLEFATVQHAIVTAQQLAAECGKTVDFVVSTNGWSLTPDRLEWLAQHPVKLELSLDGDPATQATWRKSNIEGEDSYTRSIATHAEAIVATGLKHDVIMVVQPRTASRLSDGFFHIADLGFSRIQINFALGVRWSRPYMEAFAEQLRAIAAGIAERRTAGREITLVNAEDAPMPIRLNGEIHVDWDGTVYGSNGFLNETERKAEFVVGHLDDLACFDRYWMDAPTNDFLLERTYTPEITDNNLAMGRVMASFVRWYRRDVLGISA